MKYKLTECRQDDNNEKIEDEVISRSNTFQALCCQAVSRNSGSVIAFHFEEMNKWSYGFYSSDSFYKLGEILGC